MRAALIAALLASSSVAAAEPAAPAAGAKIALVGLRPMTDDVKDIGAYETLVATALAGVPDVEIIRVKDVKKAIKAAKRSELTDCTGEPACVAEIAKLVGADHAVVGEVGTLTEGDVVYLSLVDVASAAETATTTAILGAGDAVREAEVRGAAFRLLAPDRYVGTLKLSIDVGGAVVYIDGREAARSPAPPITLSVGTHALRVTHPEYRDYVRFVDVLFDDTQPITIDLKAYPVVSDEMRQKQRAKKISPIPEATGPVAPRPWYQSWWTVAGGATAIVVVTALIVSSGGGIDRDREVTVGQ